MCASTIPAEDNSSKARSSLIELGKKFDRLEIELDFAEVLRRMENGDLAGNALLEKLCQEKLEVMFEICCVAVSIPANKPADLKIKCRMLKTYCVTGDKDLVHDLAASVCDDIQRAAWTDET